jgi:RNA polymerase sigma-70 factor (ECF subfamily)
MSPTTDAMPDNREFVHETEAYRRELLAHCYRMLGSADDAEDSVQETYLRAWRSYGGFEGRSSVRTWLYRIATNVCLTAAEQRGRRPLPSGLAGPGENPETPPAAGAGVSWLQPIPDALVTPESDDPAVIVASRERLRLALIAGLQYLPARQRAVLILRDVLAWPAVEVAEVLGTTTAAVKSSLQRARVRLEAVAPAAGRVTEPAEPDARALLHQYIEAFERADPDALARVLRTDLALELPPSPTWFLGGEARECAVLGLGSPGDWRMVPTSANGQPAAAAYRRGAHGAYEAYAIVVLTVNTTGIARIVVFGDPGLFPTFGVPSVHPTASAGSSGTP